MLSLNPISIFLVYFTKFLLSLPSVRLQQQSYIPLHIYASWLLNPYFFLYMPLFCFKWNLCHSFINQFLYHQGFYQINRGNCK